MFSCVLFCASIIVPAWCAWFRPYCHSINFLVIILYWCIMQCYLFEYLPAIVKLYTWCCRYWYPYPCPRTRHWNSGWMSHRTWRGRCRGCRVDIIPCTGDVTFGIYNWVSLSFVLAFISCLLLGNVINSSFVFVNLNVGNELSYLFASSINFLFMFSTCLMMSFVITCSWWDIGIATQNPMSSGLQVATQCKLPLTFHDSDGIFIPSHTQILRRKYYYHTNPSSRPKT